MKKTDAETKPQWTIKRTGDLYQLRPDNEAAMQRIADTCGLCMLRYGQLTIAEAWGEGDERVKLLREAQAIFSRGAGTPNK